MPASPDRTHWLGCREPQNEPGATFGRTLRHEVTAVCARDPARDCQAQPHATRPAARPPFYAEVALEHVRHELLHCAPRGLAKVPHRS